MRTFIVFTTLLLFHHFKVPADILRGNQVIQIPAKQPQSMNVSVAGTLVMYDRFIKEEVE